MEDKKIRDLLQQQFDAFEAEPPQFVWEHIEAEIQGKKRRTPFIWTGLAVAASLALILALVLRKPAPENETQRVADGQIPDRPATEQVMPDQPANQTPTTVITGTEITPGKPRQRIRAIPVSRTEDSSTPAESHQNHAPAVNRASLAPIYGLTRPERQPLLASNEVRQNARPRQLVEPLVNRPSNQPVEVVQGSKSQINLSELEPKDAVVLATQELNKLLDTPVSVSRKEVGNTELVTYEVDLKFLKITRKTSKPAKVN